MKMPFVAPAVILTFMLSACCCTQDELSEVKPATPQEAIAMLKAGNERFVHWKMRHPHCSTERIAILDRCDQGKHAYATIFCCSDSRVPPEYIFDQGFMDLFVVRTAGNVTHQTEVASVEYGAFHVHTPVVVVLGHTKCGAVNAVANTVCPHHGGHAHALEKNIVDAVAPIIPAVKKAVAEHPELTSPSEIAECAIADNVRLSMQEILRQSPEMRAAVKSGEVQLVGAIYHLDTREVEWLPDNAAGMLNTL